MDDELPTYDVQGRVIARRDLRGNQTLMAYDSSGRQIPTTDALGNQTRTQYDVAGNVVKTRDALNRETEFEYDAFVRRVRTILPAATPGDPTAVTTPDVNGFVTKYFYDTLRRMIRLEDPANGTANA